ncbi:primosomal protein N' (replication factor Y) [Rhodoblastus acidophilus]|uniref:primosomal protein N' n=1 Tax=Rhodoblastus acidophilus TaxID=1074 RepID=UPI002224C545|nr:primosomal protein N' [Rhodoblastus acidophilus]MCW2285848.1 primosomal protein N' (replication factor Y) [Rhodoblastus acidophilus]MCW2334742.1 primosomal protein N' (replication factor Y) [Rhodoblastus acidophilus]
MAPTIAEVLVPVAVDQTYSYAIPPGLALSSGEFVEVPLGARKTYGVVWAVRPGGAANLKPIEARLDFPPLPQKLRDFLDWVAAWSLAPRGMVLRMSTHAAVEAGPEPLRIGLRATGVPPKRLTEARGRALAALPAETALTKAELARVAGVSPSVIDALIDDGALQPVALGPEPAAHAPDPDFCRARLSEDQAKAAAALREAAGRKEFKPILLEGVTGSGKTEVYFEAVAEVLAGGGQVLILMPEIALTSQFRDRFSQRFGAAPAEWHSELTPRRRARVWRGAADGEVRVVAGARSALFLPFQDLRLIVVDEEHEAAYKQEEGVIYHARDMAVVRARNEGCAVVLASATPSIETRENARQGRYGSLRLQSRFAGRLMPAIKAIDLRANAASRGKWVSPPLVEALKRNLERGEQSLLFLNRRGYAPLTLCRACGHKFECPNCSAWLVEHRFRRALVCHHCGHVERRPDICPACSEADTLSACGPGVERLAEEAAEILPDARLLVLSSDMPGGTERMRAELQAIADHKVDLVIGTQLVAKGHNFPHLTLVGVVDADIGLSNGDPRAAERTFQLLNQVAGRAGRGEKPGAALLQTYQPDHPVLRALLSGDFERFYAEETQARRIARLPPFGRLAGVIVSGSDRNAAELFARALARAAALPPENRAWRVAPPGALPGEDDIAVFGPVEAPIAMVRGRYRFRLLIKAPRKANIQAFLRAMRANAPKPTKDLKISIDVDPQNFL